MPRLDDEEDYLWGDDDEEDEDEEEYEDEEEGELDQLIDVSGEMVETGESIAAMRLWRHSIDRFSDEPRAYVAHAEACLGYLMEQLGDEPLRRDDEELQPVFKRAVFAAEEALGIEPEEYEAWNILGELYRLQQNTELALNAWNKSLELNPDQDAIEAKRDIAEDEAAT